MDVTEGLERIDGGFRVRRLGDLYFVDVLLMIFNARLALTPVACPWSIDRAWCYLGPDGLANAVREAQNWPMDNPDHMPKGWYKEVHTGKLQPEFFHR